MKVSATAFLLAASLGVSAHPSGHVHRQLHRSVFVKSGKPNVSPSPAYSPPETVSTVQYTADPTPPSKHEQSSYPEPDPDSQSNSDDGRDNGLGLSTKQPLCPDNQKRDTSYADIVEVGNTGGKHFGCNLQLVQASVASAFQYTIKLNNVNDRKLECACSLKAAENGGPNAGTFKGGELFKFKLGPKKYQFVAADQDTKGSCACGAGELQVDKNGQFGGTWIEFDFDSKVNKKPDSHWSGSDASALTSLASGLEILGMCVRREGGSENPSIICPGAKKGSTNSYFYKDSHSKGGIGLNMMTDGKQKISLVADLDYQCSK